MIYHVKLCVWDKHWMLRSDTCLILLLPMACLRWWYLMILNRDGIFSKRTLLLEQLCTAADNTAQEACFFVLCTQQGWNSSVLLFPSSRNCLFPELPNHCPAVIAGRARLLTEVFFLAQWSMICIYYLFPCFPFRWIQWLLSIFSFKLPLVSSPHVILTVPCTTTSSPAALSSISFPSADPPQSHIRPRWLYGCRTTLTQPVFLWGLNDCVVVSRTEIPDFFPSQRPFLASITVDHRVDK